MIEAKTLRISFLYRIFLDVFILASLLSVAHNVAAFWSAFASKESASASIGFLCGDPSLSYPYVGNSVSRHALYRIGQQAPLLIIVIVEVLRFRSDAASRLRLHLHQATGSYFAAFLLQLYQPTSCFLFGCAAERLVRSISKHCFPRLRPHFFDVCRPQLLGGEAALANTCAGSAWPLQHRFVDDYTCAASVAVTPEMLHGLSSSFPSGHASISCFGMVFVVLYLQRRLLWRRSHLLRPTLQLPCLLVAWYVSLSRIWDHMHHAGDVLAGAALGTAIAVAAAHYVGNGCSADEADVDEAVKMARADMHKSSGEGEKTGLVCSRKDDVTKEMTRLQGVA